MTTGVDQLAALMAEVFWQRLFGSGRRIVNRRRSIVENGSDERKMIIENASDGRKSTVESKKSTVESKKSIVKNKRSIVSNKMQSIKNNWGPCRSSCRH